MYEIIYKNYKINVIICNNKLIFESGSLYFDDLDEVIKFEQIGTTSETKFIILENINENRYIFQKRY